MTSRTRDSTRQARSEGVRNACRSRSAPARYDDTRPALAAEHTRLWPLVVDLYGGYRDYQERTDREIPLVILEPRTPE